MQLTDYLSSTPVFGFAGQQAAGPVFWSNQTNPTLAGFLNPQLLTNDLLFRFGNAIAGSPLNGGIADRVSGLGLLLVLMDYVPTLFGSQSATTNGALTGIGLGIGVVGGMVDDAVLSPSST
ncbi:MAG TPA: hypothetical protein VMW69_00960 [Spirochaetia bacterium]|nr:hypothetical protein [Spirochaetia bacterium]